MNVIHVGGLSYLPSAKAIIAMTSSSELFKEPDDYVTIGKHKIVPWGADNNLPQEIVDKIEKSEVVGANLEFNVNIGFGQGIKPMRRVVEGNKVVGYEEILSDTKITDFCESNDINGYFLEQLTDLKTFYNTFPEVILSRDRKSIVQLRSKEAVFSRWGKIDPKEGRITKHFYCAKWGDNPKIEDIAITDVLDRFNPVADLRKKISDDRSKNFRYVVPTSLPSPGKAYYQRAWWWSIFQSGWYDFSVMVPEAKKALMQNHFGVKYIIYLSPKYFKNIFKDEGIDPTDEAAQRARIDQEHSMFSEFLAGSENAGRGIVALKEMVNTSMGSKEEKYIEIVPVNIEREGGEFIDDSEEVSNIISYVMGVHSSLIGSTPGKSKGSFSGTDKRELFMMKQALMRPYRDRLLRPLSLIKQFNNWDKNMVWAVPDYEFTTLDQNKSGQQTKINE